MGLGETEGLGVAEGKPIATGLSLSRGSGASDRPRPSAQGLFAQAGSARAMVERRKKNLGDTIKDMNEHHG